MVLSGRGSSFGIMDYKYGLQTDEGLLVSFVNSEFRDLVRVKVSN